MKYPDPVEDRTGMRRKRRRPGRKTARNRLSLLTLLLLKLEHALFPAIRALLLLCCSDSQTLRQSHPLTEVLQRRSGQSRYGNLTYASILSEHGE